MSESIKSQILAELNAVTKMIDSLPQSSAIDRISLEARKLKLEAEIAELTANNTNKENNMSGWITDRKPTAKDVPQGYVWVTINNLTGFSRLDAVKDGVPWMPMERPEPYVKQKRYKVEYHNADRWVVINIRKGWKICDPLPTREAAERVAAIYEEVWP